MKKIFLFLICFSLKCAIFAQQRPQYTQYIFNNYLLNPALSGIENYIDAKVGYRKQWTGITDAPQTGFATVNWNLNGDYLWRNPLSLGEKDDHPMSKNYMQNYTASPAHHGAGATVVMDKTGPISRMDANLTYAYHLKLTDRINLSTGIALGISKIDIDINKLYLEDPNDPALKNTVTNQIKPDLSIGVWVYGAHFFGGASIQQVIPQKMSFTTDANYTQGKQTAHYFITGGYRFFIAEDIAIVPSVMVKYINNAPLSFDINSKFTFKDKFWLGGSFRKDDSYAALAGFNLNKVLNLTYSYDFTTSPLNQVSSGSHEIVLGFQFSGISNWISAW